MEAAIVSSIETLPQMLVLLSIIGAAPPPPQIIHGHGDLFESGQVQMVHRKAGEEAQPGLLLLPLFMPVCPMSPKVNPELLQCGTIHDTNLHERYSQISSMMDVQLPEALV